MSNNTFSRVEEISPNTFLVVENDRFGQYPFLYVILGVDKCILIDTGCGTADYRDFVSSTINKKNLPYLVINTHVHFDHVGGNHRFCGAHKAGCVDLCMGCRDKTFSQNYEVNSLAMAHGGAQVKNYAVSRWLQEGDLIYLDDKNPTKQNSLEVVFIPGHTPDSIALYAHWEKRLFIGDHLYPFTVVHLDCIGSNVRDYLSSTQKLIRFVADQKGGGAKTDSSSEKPKATEDLSKEQKEAIEEFRSTLALERSAEKEFSVESLMELCEWNTSAAVEFYLGTMGEIGSMCPPKQSQKPTPAPAATGDIKISCGHVEANLSCGALEEVAGLLEVIRADALPAQHIDGEYAEYSNGNFTLMLPRKPKWDK